MRGLTLLVAATLLLAPPPAAAERIKVAVLDLKATGVEATLAANLSAVVVAELAKVRALEVITRQEIDQMLSFEEDRQKLGCTDASCLAEIGGALGVDLLLSGSVGRVGDKFLINLQLIDIKAARVEHRVQREAGTEPDLLGGAATAARRLLAPVLGARPGRLVLLTREEGANVFLDDVLLGVTPVGALEVPAGPHVVRVSKKGFIDWGREIDVAPEQAAEVDVTLLPSQEFIAEYTDHHQTLRTWAWITTAAAAAFGGAALGLFLYADQTYYPEEVEPYRSKCVELDPSCDAAMRDKATTNGRTYDGLIYAVYGLEAGLVAAAGVALYCWLAGEDPDRYSAYRSTAAAPTQAPPLSFSLAPTPDGALLRAGLSF